MRGITAGYLALILFKFSIAKSSASNSLVPPLSYAVSTNYLKGINSSVKSHYSSIRSSKNIKFTT